VEETTKREWEAELDEYIIGIEKRLGRKFDEGYEKKAISMRLAFDVVRMCYRPLVWYFVSYTVSFLVLGLSSCVYFASYIPLQTTLLTECPPPLTDRIPRGLLHLRPPPHPRIQPLHAQKMVVVPDVSSAAAVAAQDVKKGCNGGVLLLVSPRSCGQRQEADRVRSWDRGRSCLAVSFHTACSFFGPVSVHRVGAAISWLFLCSYLPTIPSY
jgi:hypothetical protein